MMDTRPQCDYYSLRLHTGPTPLSVAAFITYFKKLGIDFFESISLAVVESGPEFCWVTYGWLGCEQVFSCR